MASKEIKFWIHNDYPAQEHIVHSSIKLPEVYEYPAHEYITRSNAYQPYDVFEYNANAVVGPIALPFILLGWLLDDGQSHRR